MRLMELTRMTGLLEHTNSFVISFEATPGHARGWVNDLRKRAIETFRKVGFPTTSQEEWRDTNVSILAKTPFVAAPVVTGQGAIDLAQRYTFGKAAAAELVFINGHFDPHLSTVSGLPKGVRVLSL